MNAFSRQMTCTQKAFDKADTDSTNRSKSMSITNNTFGHESTDTLCISTPLELTPSYFYLYLDIIEESSSSHDISNRHILCCYDPDADFNNIRLLSSVPLKRFPLLQKLFKDDAVHFYHVKVCIVVMVLGLHGYRFLTSCNIPRHSHDKV